MTVRGLGTVLLLGVFALSACGSDTSTEQGRSPSSGSSVDLPGERPGSGSDLPTATTADPNGLPTAGPLGSGLPAEDEGASDNPDVGVAPTTTIPVPTTTTPPPPEPPPCLLDGDVLFASNEWVLRTTIPLRRLSDRIRAQADNPRMRIIGHTDSRDSNAYNQRLSERRAQSVRRWFVADGFPGNRITARGAGELRPAVPDRDASGRFIPSAGAQNRRVEIFVFSRRAVEC